ncbi:hypothetical protein [Breoghania sp.]|uniref:hypothetical protein n=1 Tax=Breoghania sp. TaxID=2065378 RepID=UPI00261AA9A0|nr:hypothetical protein [Breoghania sp.]MDJ0932503.1 hypothetical protein [Breoghania sp.]
MVVRLFGWSVLAVLAAFLLNNYLTYWLYMPGAFAFSSGDPTVYLQSGLYVVGIAAAFIYVRTHRDTPLRVNSQCISDINAFIIRAAFWTVLIVSGWRTWRSLSCAWRAFSTRWLDTRLAPISAVRTGAGPMSTCR